MSAWGHTRTPAAAAAEWRRHPAPNRRHPHAAARPASVPSSRAAVCTIPRSAPRPAARPGGAGGPADWQVWCRWSGPSPLGPPLLFRPVLLAPAGVVDALELGLDIGSLVERQPAAQPFRLAGRAVGELRVGVQTGTLRIAPA